MRQRGAIPLFLLLTIIGLGLLVGVFLISKKTGFLSNAFFYYQEGPPNSAIIKIATPSASLVASSSATPRVSSPAASLKPLNVSSKSAETSPAAKLKSLK